MSRTTRVDPTSERSAGLGAGMTTSDRTTALVIRWMAVYTRRLDRAVAARQQAELASDLWEQRAHARQVGAPDPLVALSSCGARSPAFPPTSAGDSTSSRQPVAGRAGSQDGS
jgi:hypothetical protein